MMHCNHNATLESLRSIQASSHERMMKRHPHHHHNDTCFLVSPNGENDSTLTIPKTQHHHEGDGDVLRSKETGLKLPSIENKTKVSTLQQDSRDPLLVNTTTTTRTTNSIFLYPTPITTKREHLSVVKEIKLGSWWTNQNDHNFSAELLKKLLLDQQPEKKVPEETSSSPIKCDVDTASTSQEDTEEDSSCFATDEEEDQQESSYATTSSTLNIDEASTMDRGDKWNQRFHELRTFRDNMGHTLVPHNWKSNRSLAQWVKRQRYQFKLKCEGKHSTLSDDRMEILKKVGFVWSRHGASWEERYSELAEFAKNQGHCNVPSNYPENHQLSVWVRCQRRQYKLGQCKRLSTMTPERIVRLNRLGFLFNPRNIK